MKPNDIRENENVALQSGVCAECPAAADECVKANGIMLEAAEEILRESDEKEKNNKPFQRSDLDKDFIVEINQNNLYFNNSAVYFEHNIYSFVLFDDRIIVQLNELDASAKSDEIDNVYAVDMEGNIIWRIQNKERVCPEYKFISPYVMINYIDGELIVNDFNGFRFVFSPDDGTFVKRIQSLRPW